MILKILLVIVVFLNLILSIFVISQNTKSLNSRFFSLLAFLAALWTFANFMTGVEPIELWLQGTYALGALVVATGLIWILVITEHPFNNKKSIFIILVAVLFAIWSFQDGFIAKQYDAIYIGGVFTGKPGFGLWIYTIFYLWCAFLILWKLFNAFKKTKDAQKKLQLESIFFVAIIFCLIVSSTKFLRVWRSRSRSLAVA